MEAPEVPKGVEEEAHRPARHRVHKGHLPPAPGEEDEEPPRPLPLHGHEAQKKKPPQGQKAQGEGAEEEPHFRAPTSRK
ncbi:hypothetical protein TthTMY_06410 [Thermus thermophilus]|nr:hypothetical protein TthTMY_06410 [Thermus thermophilus]